jgi:hypothetical protein
MSLCSRLAGTVLLSAMIGGPVYAQAEGFLLYTDPERRYSIEFPRDWRWEIVAGSREPMAVFVHPRSEAALIVERLRMRQRLAPGEVTEVFAEIEADSLKESQPRVSNVSSRIETWGSQRVIIIDYRRPGIDAFEQVRQYSFPVDQDLYRITCAALASRFQTYQGTCTTVARTLKPSGVASPPTTR